MVVDSLYENTVLIYRGKPLKDIGAVLIFSSIMDEASGVEAMGGGVRVYGLGFRVQTMRCTC